MDTVAKISDTETGPMDKPKQPVMIAESGVLE